MSADDHRGAARQGPFGVHLVMVAAARTARTDKAGQAAAAAFEDALHTVLSRETVPNDVAAIRKAVKAAAGRKDCQVVLLTGGTGFSRHDVTPEAVEGLYSKPIPGFGELFRLVSYREVGTAAMFSRATAGVVDGALVFALPGSVEAVELAVTELILPELAHLVREVEKAGPAPVLGRTDDDDIVDAEVESIDEPEADDEDDDGPKLPPPEARWRLGLRAPAGQGTVEAAPIEAESPEPDSEDEVPDRGWKRAVYDLQAEVVRGKAPDLPPSIEKLAPAMDVLNQAGEIAQLKLPSGNRMTIYGFPDLQRANSKVIAVGWGEPFAEVIALHRYPVQAGLCIDEDRGLMPGRASDVSQVAEAITGRKPEGGDGTLFAVDHDAVYIQRGKWVFRWDGRRERQEGNEKQTLATLLIGWHNR